MPPTPAVSRRLGLLTPPIPGAPLPPVGAATIAGTQNPDFGSDVTQTPAAVPGMLPNISVEPLYDPTAPPKIAAPVGDGAGDGWRGALQRALIGFSKGASRVQVDPTYNPVGAGLVGGGEAIGAGVADSVNRRLALQAAALQPFKDAQAAALKASYEDVAHAPGEAAKNQATLNREIALQKDKLARETDPSLLEPLAQHIATLPPSLRRVELGKQAGPVAMVLAARVAAINKDNPKTDTQREEEYKAETAGMSAGATYDATVPQASARAAHTVQLLLPELRKASEAYSRPEIRSANGVLNWYDNQTGGTKAQTFQQYLLEAKAKAASALVAGGAPQVEAQAKIDKIFPDTMGPEQLSAAADTMDSIMENQKTGALTRVPLPSTTPAPAPATPAAPRTAAPKAGGSSWRKY